VTLLLIVTGSLVSQGVMNFWLAVGLAGTGSVIGDQIGYAIGRWGGSELTGKLTRLVGGKGRWEAAQEKARDWGGSGIFITRWLVTALGPPVNLASGLACYPWVRFLFWDALGEFFGVGLYVTLGHLFSDRVTELDALLGDLSWAVLALLAAVWIAWRLFFASRTKP
jgi:membrane-associated protein